MTFSAGAGVYTGAAKNWDRRGPASVQKFNMGAWNFSHIIELAPLASLSRGLLL
jgi:hypothetical protein